MYQTVNNVSITENGMVGYKTTYHPLLDMNFKITSYRNKTDKEIIADLKQVLNSEDSSYVLRFLFMVRDVREGLGERRLFRLCIKELLNHNFVNKEEIVKDIINNLISEYGRYDDLFVFIGTEYESNVIKKIRNQLSEDIDNQSNNKPISLLAKWLPSENASSRETKSLARKIMNELGASPRQYRKVLSSLRAYLKVTEVQTSANDWSNIDYNIVPSKANLKYKNAFLRHDEARRREYLAKLAVGDKSVKINSSVNYPHDIAMKYRNGGGWYSTVGAYDETLEQLWKNLPQMKGMENTIVVRDGSGSMYQPVQVGNTVQAIDVATALTIYCAERLNAEFKDKFITFSSRPQMVDLSNYSSLHSKLNHLRSYSDCSNTNLEAVFDLILKTAKDHNMKQEDIPSQILIVSDMEFDGATTNRNMGNVIELAQRNFESAGYKLPKLVFWNVCSRTNTIPCKHNENGVLLVSGFSVNVLKMVMNGETDPYKALLKELNSERYTNIPLIEIVYNNVKKKTVNKNITKPSWL
jgi:hypothetical protein